jgi:hypothetical protein
VAKPETAPEPLELDDHEKLLIVTALRRAVWGLDMQLEQRLDRREQPVYDTAFYFSRMCRNDINKLIDKLVAGGWQG